MQLSLNYILYALMRCLVICAICFLGACSIFPSSPQTIDVSRTHGSSEHNHSHSDDGSEIYYDDDTANEQTSSAKEPWLKSHLKLPGYSSNKAGKVIKKARQYIGTPYRYGGMSYNGIDCSGLVFHSFKAANINMPRTSAKQAERGHSVSRGKLKKGDLVYFATGRSKSRVTHVGIMVNKHSFIHASSSRGVMISKLSNVYWSPRYLFAKRVL